MNSSMLTPSRIRRFAIGAASLAMAGVAASVVLASQSGYSSRRIALFEALPDVGEDYFSAIEQPHKIYEWPWLKDQKFQYEARVLGYGPPETWDRERNGHLSNNAYMGWNDAYTRTAFDEVCEKSLVRVHADRFLFVSDPFGVLIALFVLSPSCSSASALIQRTDPFYASPYSMVTAHLMST
jgi:hypothetical protein